MNESHQEAPQGHEDHRVYEQMQILTAAQERTARAIERQNSNTEELKRGLGLVCAVIVGWMAKADVDEKSIDKEALASLKNQVESVQSSLSAMPKNPPGYFTTTPGPETAAGDYNYTPSDNYTPSENPPGYFKEAPGPQTEEYPSGQYPHETAPKKDDDHEVPRVYMTPKPPLPTDPV